MADDPFQLGRFVTGQEENYSEALQQIQAGQKTSHWMWYVFPQFTGLGFSSTSQFYAIKSVDEAKAYLNHPILGPRLNECCQALLGLGNRSALAIFGSTDASKLRSSMTLFAAVSPEGSLFRQVLTKYFKSEPDEKTLKLLESSSC